VIVVFQLYHGENKSIFNEMMMMFSSYKTWKFVTKNMKQIKLFNTSRHFYSHIGLVWFMVFNATFNNISLISWQSVLLVEETRVPGENHRPIASQ
jgi:hypothetical protein